MLDIVVLGVGCVRTRELLDKVRKGISLLRLKAKLTQVEDVDQFLQLELPSTPALIINGELVFSGEVPSQIKITSILQDYDNISHRQAKKAS